jgi:integrase
MPSLFKRSNGIYYAVISDDAGGRRWVSTGETRKAPALKQLVSISAAPQHAQFKKKRILEFFDELKEYGDAVYSKENLAIYQRAFDNFIPGVGNVLLGSVTQRQIDNFKATRLKSVKAVTVNLELRTLRSAFYTALRWKLIQENPFKGVRLCSIADGVPPYFSQAEFQTLVSAIEEEWLRDLVYVAGLTGMRRGELVHLRWSDVDLKNQSIRIQSAANFRTKRGKCRVVPINPEVEKVLVRRNECSNGEYVFHVDGRMIHEQGLSRWFKRYVRRSKLNSELHFHSLRHSFASWLVQGDVSLYQVQKLLGHSSIKVTEMYGHLLTDDLRGAVNRIEVPYAKAVPGESPGACSM